MSKSKALILKITIPIAILSVFLVVALFTVVIIRHVPKGNDTYRRIRTSRDTEEQVWSDWYYNDVKYSVAPGLSLWHLSSEECTEENGLSLISWFWYLPFYRVETFADNVENPRYLYCPYRASKSLVRVNENFDYMDEEYIICNQTYSGYERIRSDTEFSFKLKDVYYTDECIKREYGIESVASFFSRSKSFEKLEFHGCICLIDGEYYVDLNDYGLPECEYTYKAKPEFIELLKEAGILS